MSRPSWDQTWMAVADTIARRSRCSRRKAGCVLVGPDQRIIASGYNNPPAGMHVGDEENECSSWCPRALSGGQTNDYSDCPSAHSEANALMFSDRSHRESGTAYVTSCPCLTCAKNLANSGISRVVFRIGPEDAVRDPGATIEFFRQCGVTVDIFA